MVADVTAQDDNHAMTKVGIADLRANLSGHLKRVRAGRSLIVTDHDTPIARIVPLDEEAPLRVRRASRRPSSLELPPRLPHPTDSLALLIGDSASR
jgi:prevent-host-death family protein